MSAFTKARVEAQGETQSAMQSVNEWLVEDGGEELTLKQPKYEGAGMGQASHIRFNLPPLEARQSWIER